MRRAPALLGRATLATTSIVALAACSDETQLLATAAPGVVYTYPLDAQLDVPLGARVLVTFSDPVEASALGACTGSGNDVEGAFCVVGPDGPLAGEPKVVGDGKTIELTGIALAPGTTYAVFARPQLAKSAANLPATGPLLHFTTRSIQPRGDAPTLVAVNGGPPDKPEAFRPMFETSTIRLLFSEPLDPRTIAIGPGAIQLLDDAGAAVPVTLLSEGIHVSLDPIADLAPDRTYQLVLGNKLADVGGQVLAPITVPLTPKNTGAATPIRQVLRTRQTGDRGPEASHAGATRNEIAIDKPLVGRETAQILPGALATEMGDPTALGGPLAFTLRRGQRLRTTGLDIHLGGEIPVNLNTQDIYIELLSDAGGRIYRNPYQPADQRPENLRAPLFVDLSMDVAVFAADPAGNAVLTQTVLGVQASGAVIATDGVLDIESVIAMDLGLLGVARAPSNLVLELITDLDAKPEADATAPTLVASLPTLPGGELPVDAGVELIFSEPIDLDRARAGGVVLQTAAGATVATAIESHGSAIVVRPLAPLTYGTSYRVDLADVADVAGNALAAPATATALAFTTPPLVATKIPLSVIAVHPGAPCALTGATAATPGHCASGKTDDQGYHPFTLPANENITVTFTQPPTASTIVRGTACGTGSVRIEQLDAAGACTGIVAGALSRHDRTLTFLPEQPWQDGARYRLTLISGNNKSCAAGEICGISGDAASWDPLAGASDDDGGGPDLVIDFVGAPATDATMLMQYTAPYTDMNGSGTVDTGEHLSASNRVALRITGRSGVITSAKFRGDDCLPGTPDNEACMYLSGVLPVELRPVSHECPLPGGGSAPACVPVVITAQAMYATSIGMTATGVFDIDTEQSVMRLRQPASGPIIGYLYDDNGTPTMVVALELYLDAPDMSVPLGSHDLHSKLLAVTLKGPMAFLPDGRIQISLSNTAEVPVVVNVSVIGIDGSVQMVVPQGEMKIQLVSAPLRGGLP